MPRFMDTVESVAASDYVRQAAGPSLPLMTSSGQEAFSPHSWGQRRRHFSQNYRYWNYVAISRVNDRVSSLFPNVGMRTTAVTTQQSVSWLNDSQRQHINRYYGGRLQSHEDLKPAPEDHPMIQLLRRVNDEESWLELVDKTFLYWQLCGKFFWWLVPSGLTLPSGYAMPAEIWCIPNDMVSKINRNQDGTIKEYVVHNGRWSEPIPADQIIWAKLPHPAHREDGYSPIDSSPLWTTNVEDIEVSRGYSFKNQTKPDLIVTLKDAKPDPDLINRIKERIMERAAGLDRTGEPFIVPPSVDKIDKWGTTPKEMDFLSSADQAKDFALAMHCVPKVVAGITTDVNRNTVDGANVVFCENKINPSLARFAAFLTEKLAVRFDPRLFLWYDTCTPKSAEQEFKENQLDFQMGAYDPDERRVDRGRKPKGTPLYQTGYLPSSVIPLDDDLRQPPEPAPDPNAEDPAATDPADSTDPEDAADEADPNEEEDPPPAKVKKDPPPPKKKAGGKKQNPYDPANETFPGIG